MIRERTVVGRVLQRHWTDLAVVVGKNIRSVAADYEDLDLWAPEALLGYRVLLATPEFILQGGLRGHRPMKGLVISGVQHHPNWRYAYDDLRIALQPWNGHTVWYRVHRGLDPVVKEI